LEGLASFPALATSFFPSFLSSLEGLAAFPVLAALAAGLAVFEVSVFGFLASFSLILSLAALLSRMVLFLARLASCCSLRFFSRVFSSLAL
jgi:biotin transporter BioY